MDEVQYANKGCELLDVINELARIGVVSFWLEKDDFDCAMACVNNDNRNLYNIDVVFVMPESTTALKHDSGLLVKCASEKKVKGMSDQDRITVNGVELVRVLRTDPAHCYKCEANGNDALCLQLPCTNESYFVRVEK